MNNLYCICGRSGAGKDTIAHRVAARLNATIVCSYTDKEIRGDQLNGREHWFVSAEEFQSILRTESIVAYTEIKDEKTGNVLYAYCATEKCLNEMDIYIIDPRGIDYLKSHYTDKPIKVIYVYSEFETRRGRALSRGDDLDKFSARCANEDDQFTAYEDNEHTDLLVLNLEDTDIEAHVQYICEYIMDCESE